MARWLASTLAIAATFTAGIFAHILYQRWNPPDGAMTAPLTRQASTNGSAQAYPVKFLPLSALAEGEEKALELPVIVARDVDKIRSLAGRQARVRGRIFRVGHSAKSNTYFLNFGPTREALTAVIFPSSVELFEKNKLAPKNYENKEVELTGQIKDHPQYGLEMILESPQQIKILP
ncbi:MAG: hypothetical protein EXR70_22625 [Deltaproteobacteria bacterium]|nr:hypothetical protein [Deltaproteobacteria bacterium]